MTAKRVPRSQINEAAVCSVIEDTLRTFGWRWIHFRPARTQHGWRTPLTGSAGFMDYLAVKGPVQLALEAKGRYEKPDDDQVAWLEAMAAAGAHAWVVNPANLDAAVALIMRPPSEPTREGF